MGDIIIPEAALDQFLKLLLAGLMKEREGLVAEHRAQLNADEAMFRARLEVMLERGRREINGMRAVEEEKIERRLRETEEKIRAVEEEIERKRRAADEEIECKMRAADAVPTSGCFSDAT